MNYNECIRLNPLPGCQSDPEDEFFLTGLVFPNNTDSGLIVRVQNTATRRIDYIIASTNVTGEASIDLSSIMPFMDHIYEMTFIDEAGLPATAELSGEQSCCVEFGINIGLTAGGWPATTGNCSIDA